MKVAFATMEKIDNRPPGSIGSSRIRAKWLCDFWPEAEEYQVGHEYDVIIFQKAYWQEMIESFKGIKIFDLCDPDWLVPRPVIQVMEYCDAMVTSTPALAEYVSKFVQKPVICIPDRVNLNEHKPRGPHEGIAKKVVWFGYAHNIHYIVKTFDFLIERNLELVLISNTPYQPPMGFERLKVSNIIYDYKHVHDALKQCDIALLPDTIEDLAGKYKSNNKTLTAWTLGLPVAKTPSDLDLFMPAEARNKEVEMRLQEVKDKWDVRKSVQEYKGLITRILLRESEASGLL